MRSQVPPEGEAVAASFSPCSSSQDDGFAVWTRLVPYDAPLLQGRPTLKVDAGVGPLRLGQRAEAVEHGTDGQLLGETRVAYRLADRGVLLTHYNRDLRIDRIEPAINVDLDEANVLRWPALHVSPRAGLSAHHRCEVDRGARPGRAESPMARRRRRGSRSDDVRCARPGLAPPGPASPPDDRPPLNGPNSSRSTTFAPKPSPFMFALGGSPLHSAALLGRISQSLREQGQDRVTEWVQDLRDLELLKRNPMRCRPVDARTETATHRRRPRAALGSRRRQLRPPRGRPTSRCDKRAFITAALGRRRRESPPLEASGHGRNDTVRPRLRH